jgi:hypothetical protein
VTHVLIYEAGRAFAQASSSEFAPADWAELNLLKTDLLLLKDYGDAYLLYELK